MSVLSTAISTLRSEEEAKRFAGMAKGMEYSEHLVVLSSSDFREPIVDTSKQPRYNSSEQSEVKVTEHEVAIVEL